MPSLDLCLSQQKRFFDIFTAVRVLSGAKGGLGKEALARCAPELQKWVIKKLQSALTSAQHFSLMDTDCMVIFCDLVEGTFFGNVEAQ